MDTNIRKTFVGATFLVCAFFSLPAHNQETFARAHKLYQEGDWEGALNAYNSIEPKGKGVWYNMGNCHYQLKDYPRAIVCWKRSQPGATSVECDDIACNVGCALDKCGAIQQPPSYLYSMLAALSSGLPYVVWQILFLIAWFVLFIFWFKGERYARRVSIMLISLFLSFVFGILLFVSYQTSERLCAIVINRGCDVYSGPHEKFDVIDTVEQGEELIIQQKRPDWYKVKSIRSSGWIPANQVEVI